jgi:lysophospholipid acyltransferase (LPLAT)-like uncharacterized protein
MMCSPVSSVLSRAFWAVAEWPLAATLFGYARLVEKTAQISIEGQLPARAAILVNFHHYQAMTQVLYRDRGIWMMVSRAPGLRPVARYCKWMGVRTARGATGDRGRQALQQLAEALGRGESVSMAVDGPAGPAFKVKGGCVDLGLQTGAPLVPVAYRCSRQIEVPRWDRALVPTPFDRIRVRYGDAVHLSGLSRDDARNRVETAMLALTNEMER